MSLGESVRSRILRVLRCAVALPALVLAQAAAHGQSRSPSLPELSAGSELEGYLRLLQISGETRWHPWAVRGFSVHELERMLPRDDSTAGPWRLDRSRLQSRGALGPLSASFAFNSAFPYGSNDGATWAGRGLTATVTAAAVARLGPLSITLAPTAFITTNGGFALLDNGQAGALAYNDGLYSTRIDRPQRFGDGAYGRGDAGASEIRLSTRFVSLGFGNAPMSWGPAVEYPFLLGTNAPGFPHAFAGTGSPVPIGVGRIHGRAMWGKLSQSPYSPVTGPDRYVGATETGRDRLVTGLIVTFTPAPFPHLELGFAQVVHVPYTASGIDSRFIRTAWPTFLKKNVASDDAPDVEAQNSLASLFARWAFPSAGFELYAEHGHDDWYHDLRDLSQEPEHNRSYVLGFQKVAGKSGSRMSAVRGEIVNYQMPPLGRDRPGQGNIYAHTVLRQGHTQRGQLLGADAGPGAAAASIFAWDRYSESGRTTLSWRRIVRAHRGNFAVSGIVEPRATDVIHSLGAERARMYRGVRVTLATELMLNMNRNFASDVLNLNARAGLSWSPGFSRTR